MLNPDELIWLIEHNKVKVEFKNVSDSRLPDWEKVYHISIPTKDNHYHAYFLLDAGGFFKSPRMIAYLKKDNYQKIGLNKKELLKIQNSCEKYLSGEYESQSSFSIDGIKRIYEEDMEERRKKLTKQ